MFLKFRSDPFNIFALKSLSRIRYKPVSMAPHGWTSTVCSHSAEASLSAPLQAPSTPRSWREVLTAEDKHTQRTRSLLKEWLLDADLTLGRRGALLPLYSVEQPAFSQRDEWVCVWVTRGLVTIDRELKNRTHFCLWRCDIMSYLEVSLFNP